MKTDTRKGRIRQIAIPPLLLFGLTLAVRLTPGNSVIVGWDEWILAAITSRVALWFVPGHLVYDILVPTGYSYPPFHFWLSGALVWLFGPEPIVWRIPAILSDAGTVALTYILARRMAGKWAGWTAGLIACATLYLAFHETVSLDYMLSFWVMLSLVLYLVAMDRESPALLALCVLAAGMGCFTKYHGVIYLGTLCLLLVAVPDSRRLLRGRWLVLTPAAALALPAVMLSIEALTWRFYGFPKTHLAEVWRVMHWVSYVVDPLTGAITQPTWYYYFAYAWDVLGPLWCGLVIVGIGFTASERRRDGLVLIAVLAIWMLWASTGNLKNARYVLPMAYVGCVLAGVAVATIACVPKGKPIAVVLITAIVALGLWNTADRLRHYLAEGQRNASVYAYVNQHTPPGALLMSEAMAFQADDSVGIAGIKRKVMTPESAGWLDKADYLVLDARSFDLLRNHVIPSAPNYIEERTRAARDWPEVFRVGEGRMAVSVLKRPSS